MSYYALFKWWLLLSQHPSCLSTSTSFFTECVLGTLAGGLGCFPLVLGAYPPKTDSRTPQNGIRSSTESGRLVDPQHSTGRSTPAWVKYEASPKAISGRTR